MVESTVKQPKFALSNKKSRQYYYRRGSLLNYEQLLLAEIKKSIDKI